MLEAFRDMWHTLTFGHPPEWFQLAHVRKCMTCEVGKSYGRGGKRA